MRTRSGMIVLLLLFVSGGPIASAESRPPGFEAAFECAALAAYAAAAPPSEASQVESGYGNEVDRLFRYGYAEATPFISEMKAEPGIAKNLAYWRSLDDLSEDFWVGVFWAGALSEVAEFLEEKVPFDLERSSTATRKLRQLVAMNEFEYRNCALIGH